mmetsp:Transcript_12080/g.22453  ORF Transcript_12080/g.22453 Transcript_12080/m.22453 type:complete len:331 (-) Transcript_12080:63-1055(-)
MQCCGPPKKCCTCKYHPATQPDECRCGCGYYHGIFQTLLSQFLLFCGFWFAVTALGDCSFVQVDAPIFVREDGTRSSRLGFLSYTDDSTGECYFWSESITVDGKSISGGYQLQFYLQDVLGREWVPSFCLSAAACVLSFLLFLYITSYCCATQVRCVRYFTGFLLAIVVVVLQGLTYLVFSSSWCTENGCETSRSSKIGIAATVCFFLSGSSFFFMSDYPGKQGLAEIQQEHEKTVVGDEENPALPPHDASPDDREDEPSEEEPLPGDEEYIYRADNNVFEKVESTNEAESNPECARQESSEGMDAKATEDNDEPQPDNVNDETQPAEKN